ncbi:50S ribosomal protein L29 [Saezia sanguinis]|jgi:large subunit ribosomal protein L29|uniref:Large ribosomal subunit protein uL29 n=2 Tax=Saezia sanguinis TaxID=1965230 RepID=A0A433SBX7_9BURK|nr:50S ribosomal protein L29 [Saezia sanguinis]
MKASELREKDVAGVEKELAELQRAYFGARMQKATNQLTNTASLKSARRDVARAKTVLTEKQRKGAAK